MKRGGAKKFLPYIDYLKALGLLLIILAHSCDNQIIMQLRIFDVPLMVVISGLLAYDSYKRSLDRGGTLLDYYKKRITRLLIPAWIFLTFYFLFLWVENLGGAFPYTPERVMRSYLLLDGIGYVWIIRVYLLCALITPLAVFLKEKLKKNYLIYILLLVLYVGYEIAVCFGLNELNMFFEFILAYLIPYGVIYALGMLCAKSKNKYYSFILSGIFLVIFSIVFILLYNNSGQIVPLRTAKYPPTIYFISYSLFMSFLLIGISKRLKLKSNRLVQFISRSSLWIYLWHILMIHIVECLNMSIWPPRYILIVIGACIITYAQNKVVDYLERNTKINKKLLALFRG